MALQVPAEETGGSNILLAVENESAWLAHFHGAAYQFTLLLHAYPIAGYEALLASFVPHIQMASYTQEHPGKAEILIQCQTNGLCSAEQTVVESVHLTKDILEHMESTMEEAVEAWESKHGAVKSL